MDTIKDITAVVGCISAILALAVAIIKPLRNRFIAWVRGKTNSSELENKIDEFGKLLRAHIEKDEEKIISAELSTEALLCMLRNEITTMYYKYTERESIPAHERENLVKLYTCYHSMHGNSYIDIIYEEMLELSVKG